MTKISAVIIALNEEKNIQRCITSAFKVCDEVVVIDTFSTDNTAQISEECGAKVIKQVWQGFAETKNIGNKRAKHGFILSLDADEELSPQLIKSINNIKEDLNSAYSFNRLNFYRHIPVRHCGWYPDKKIRLFPKDKCNWQGEYVHEKLRIDPLVRTTHLKGDLFHYTIESIKQHESTIEKYATLAAEELAKKNKHISFFKPYISYATMFLKKYLLQLGIVEGANGMYISHYSAMSRYLRYKKAISLKNQKTH
jgi:glycosyltransferase involved in cell wall biosynthesis